MPEERRDHYLDTLDDAAADFWAVTADDRHAPGFDEWNALRLSQGQRPGSFTEYMREIAPLLAQGDDAPADDGDSSLWHHEVCRLGL